MMNHSFLQFAQQEFDTATTELRKRSTHESLIGFYRRHDAVVASAMETSSVKPACRAGCSYCCYYKVEARAIEILAIQQYVLTKFKPELIRSIVEQANQNVAEAKKLTHVEHLATNQRCPFLVENQCVIYPVRPSKCRNFHASDMQGCKDSYEQPTNLEIPNSYITEIFEAANGTTQGFEQATDEAGLDARGVRSKFWICGRIDESKGSEAYEVWQKDICYRYCRTGA